MSRLRALFYALILLWAYPMFAQASELFVEQAPIADEAVETRNAALSEMLLRVLMRVSGNPNIASQPATAELLKAASRLVQQYRYRSVGDGAEPTRYLWARFDQAAVERMMRERGLPVWSQRPRVLIWLATEQAGRRQLLSFDSRPAARDAVLKRAAERGLPLQLPLMDLEDQAALTPADVWSDYLQGIRAASARYPHERILTGRLSALGSDRWRGVWTLVGPGGSEVFQSPPMALDATLRFAVDQTQNLLAARYAPTPGVGVGGGTLVRFAGVRDLSDYGFLLTLLDGLEPVRSWALRYAHAEDVVFEFQLRGEPENLLRALEGSGRVIAEPLPILSRDAAAPIGADGTQALSPGFAPDVEYAYRLVN